MRNFLILAAVASMAVLCVFGQVSNTTTFDNVVVRTNLTLGGVPLSAWPSGSGDVLASNQMTNQMPLLGAGGVAIFATNTVGFRSAVGLVIGTDVQAFSSTLADWANLPTNSISAFLTEAEASALYQSTNANLTAYAADDYAAVTNALALTGSTSTYLRSDGTQATPPAGGAPAFEDITGDPADNTALASALSARRLFREAPLNVSGTEIDLSLTNRVFSKATAGNTTLTFANPTAGDFFSLIVTNGGSDTLAFPTVTWLAGSAPVLDTGAGTVNVFYFYYTGAVYIGDVGNKASPVLDAIAALANGTGALTNNGSGTFGYYDYSSVLAAKSTTLTVAGTANEITSSAGAQDLSANRTWTLSLPSSLDLGGKTVELPNSNADATLANAGEVHFNTTDEQLSFHSAADGEISGEAALSLIQHRAWVFDPDAVCDGAVDRLFLFTVGDQAPEGIKIVEWKVSFEADPTTEADLDLKYADAFIGVANAAVIDVLDTTNGASSEDTNANINGGNAIANGKVLYLEFGTAYTETGHQIIFEMWFYAEED